MKMNKRQNPIQSALHMREWIIVYLFVALLITISVVSYSKKHSLIAPEATINVVITGAVQDTKRLQIHALSTIADVLNCIELSDDADLDKLIIDERVKSGILIIPKKHKTSVYATGAVEKIGVYYVPEGSTFNQLALYIPVAEDADMRYFSRKRRVVMEGELIEVPHMS